MNIVVTFLSAGNNRVTLDLSISGYPCAAVMMVTILRPEVFMLITHVLLTSSLSENSFNDNMSQDNAISDKVERTLLP